MREVRYLEWKRQEAFLLLIFNNLSFFVVSISNRLSYYETCYYEIVTMKFVKFYYKIW